MWYSPLNTKLLKDTSFAINKKWDAVNLNLESIALYPNFMQNIPKFNI